ncbi:MAG: hypothetical protein LBD46_06605 [Endomicrobium sp.]|jgi:hypothetical protein|nr:hypothetical protein [Endomicrobium sp.]
MWHKEIECDLKDIFGVPKVLFGTPIFSKEQDVLFCEVSSSKNVIKQGKASARVEGKISIIGLIDKNKSGFLSKKIQLAPITLTNKFVFSREETPVTMNYQERFNVYLMEFLYFYKEKYNPVTKKITEISKWIIKIINKIRGQSSSKEY